MTENEQASAAPGGAVPAADALVARNKPGAADAVPIRVAPKQPQHQRHWGKWPSRLILALLLLLGFFLSVVPEGRALTRGMLLLPGLLTATQPAPLLLSSEPIAHTHLTIPSQTGPVLLDVFAPVGQPPPIPGEREAVVMITGVGDNRTDPQLINLSEALARVGVVVVNMTTPRLLGLEIQPSDEDAVMQAFTFAAHLPGVNPQGIGIVGFSGGAALACLAAADARIRDQVAFLTTFGAFYNATNLLRDFGLRAVTADGQVTPFHPGATPIKVMANLVAGTLPHDEGQRLIHGLMPGGTPLADPDAQLPTPGAAAAYHLIAGDEPDPANVEQHLAALSPAVKHLLNALSPSSVMSRIRAPIYLLHDHHDPYVPFTESRDFDAALTRLGHPHEFAEFGIFHHTQMTSGFGLGPLLTDGSTLYRILIGVLRVSA